MFLEIFHMLKMNDRIAHCNTGDLALSNRTKGME